MIEALSNRLPWSEVVSCVCLSNKSRAAAAKRFFENKRFATSQNQTKRGLIRRLTHAVFDFSLPITDIAERFVEEIREDSDAKALNACVSKIEQLATEGWHHADDRESAIAFRCLDLDIQLQPDKLLVNDSGSLLLLYSYYRRSPPLSTDAIRSLLCLIRLVAGKQKIFNDARIVVLDCYKDISYESSDFHEDEPWIAKQTDKVLSTFNAAYRIHLDGSPPTPTELPPNPRHKTRAVRSTSMGLSVAQLNDQFCFQLQ